MGPRVVWRWLLSCWVLLALTDYVNSMTARERLEQRTASLATASENEYNHPSQLAAGRPIYQLNIKVPNGHPVVVTDPHSNPIFDPMSPPMTDEVQAEVKRMEESGAVGFAPFMVLKQDNVFDVDESSHSSSSASHTESPTPMRSAPRSSSSSVSSSSWEPRRSAASAWSHSNHRPGSVVMVQSRKPAGPIKLDVHNSVLVKNLEAAKLDDKALGLSDSMSVESPLIDRSHKLARQADYRHDDFEDNHSRDCKLPECHNNKKQ